jgi:hypothetical protein
MKKKNSNIEKEMMHILHLLNEDDSNVDNTTEEELEKLVGKGRVFVTNDIRDKIVAITGNNDIKLGQLVKLNVKQLEKLFQMLPENTLKQHNMTLVKGGVPIANSPEYILSTIKSTDDLLKLFNDQFSALTRKISLIGAGAGAGITVAGWAAARAHLQKQLKKCGDDLVCIEEVKAKIRRLNTIALWSGLGLMKLGSYAATHFYTPSL